MSFSISSNIYQNNAKMLEQQQQEMQRRYEKEQRLQAPLKEAVEACHIKWAAQKTRKIAKTKTREKAKKQKLVKEKEKQKQIKYLK